MEQSERIPSSRPPREEAIPALDASLRVGNIRFANRVFLAPLSGISDVPFRRLARRFGAGMVVSEMVASGELLHGKAESRQRAMADGEGVHVVQLAGRDPAIMRDAASLVAGNGADLIDINFGCPAKKVVGGQSGSALMREPELALRIVEAVVAGAGTTPVSVKMRLGWDHASLNAADLARAAQDAGVAMVTVHGRTRQQFYEGSADWHAIRRVKAGLGVPLVANGDLTEGRDAAAMLRASGADAVMVGRGSHGRPWLPGLIAGVIGLAELSRVDLCDLVVEHYEAMLDHYGTAAGLRHARKHLGWYLERASARLDPAIAARKPELLRSIEPVQVIAELRALLRGSSAADLEPAADPIRQQAA